MGLGVIQEQSSANYTIEGVMVNQPIGEFQSTNYQIYLGPYYYEGGGTDVNATIEDFVAISVPSSISYGTMYRGYKSSEKELTITNTGTLNITVQPLLDNSSNTLFDNIYFGDQGLVDTQIGSYVTPTIGVQAYCDGIPILPGESCDGIWSWENPYTIYTQLDLTSYISSAGTKTGKIYYIAMES